MSSAKMFLAREDVRDIDRRAEESGLPTLALMETAGRGAAEVLMRLGVGGPVLVCCGKGNNGGDGLVAARHLAAWGVRVRMLMFAPESEMSPATKANWLALNAAGVNAEIAWPFNEAYTLAAIESAAWIVDALFGIGLTSPLRSPFDRLVTAINASPARVFALDVPSGLDADTGEPLGPTIRANHTATFVAQKLGFANPTSMTWTGKVHVVDLGVR